MTLKELRQSNLDLYETDKGSHWHSFAGKSYLDHYQTHFGLIRCAPGNILEIGVHHGGSVRLWRDYFNAGTVFGLDCLDVSEFQKSGPDLVIIQGSQSSADDLNRVIQHGQFKVVIDDGSHEPSDILPSFEILWPSVLPGGFYCIEDLQRLLEVGTAHILDSKFADVFRQLDMRLGDVQAVHRYAHLIMFQKA